MASAPPGTRLSGLLAEQSFRRGRTRRHSKKLCQTAFAHLPKASALCPRLARGEETLEFPPSRRLLKEGQASKPKTQRGRPQRDDCMRSC